MSSAETPDPVPSVVGAAEDLVALSIPKDGSTGSPVAVLDPIALSPCPAHVDCKSEPLASRPLGDCLPLGDCAPTRDRLPTGGSWLSGASLPPGDTLPTADFNPVGNKPGGDDVPVPVEAARSWESALRDCAKSTEVDRAEFEPDFGDGEPEALPQHEIQQIIDQDVPPHFGGAQGSTAALAKADVPPPPINLEDEGDEEEDKENADAEQHSKYDQLGRIHLGMAPDHIHVKGRDLMDDVAVGIGRVHVSIINLRAELLKYANADPPISGSKYGAWGLKRNVQMTLMPSLLTLLAT
eukprot:4904669-Amphidinium_carterae.6